MNFFGSLPRPILDWCTLSIALKPPVPIRSPNLVTFDFAYRVHAAAPFPDAIIAL